MKRRILCLLLCLAMTLGLLPATAAAAERLPTPTGLQWGIYDSRDTDYLYEPHTRFSLPGAAFWETGNLSAVEDKKLNLELKVYRADSGGEDELVAGHGIEQIEAYLLEQYGGEESYIGLMLNDWWPDASAAGPLESEHLPSGDYYFTVQYTNCSGMDDSQTARSDTWSYTRPQAKLAAPANLTWDGSRVSWTQPDGNGAQVFAYYAACYLDGVEYCLRVIRGDETSLDTDECFSGAEGVRSVRLMAFSRDLTRIQDSDWTALSIQGGGSVTPRSATLADTVIAGTVGSSIEGELTLTLTGDRFAFDGYSSTGTIPAGADLSDVISFDDVTGLSLQLKEAAAAGAQSLTLRVSGQAEQAVSGPIRLTIEGGILASGRELTTTDNPNARWNIGKDTENYDLWLGGVRVTKSNCEDILGDGTASFAPRTNTLTLSGVRLNQQEQTALRSQLPALTLVLAEDNSLRASGTVIDAPNLTVELADSRASLTVLSTQGAAFAQTPLLRGVEEIFAGASQNAAAFTQSWNFTGGTAYVRFAAHQWEKTWRYHSSAHWHACTHSGCPVVSDQQSHDLGWIADEQPYGTTPGRMHAECRVCAYQGPQQPMPCYEPGIATSALPGGEVGRRYSAMVSVNGTQPFTWKLASGTLPDGLELNARTGEISGLPTRAGTYTFLLKVTNQVSPTVGDTAQYTIQVAESTNELRFVQRLTRNSLANASAEDRESIQNAVYNLLFKAQYRPSRSVGRGVGNGEKAKFTGTIEENRQFTIQNADASKETKAYLNRIIYDSQLDPTGNGIKLGQRVGGCFAYSLFCTSYVYGSSVKTRECGKLTEAGVRDFVHRWVDPGECLRYRYKYGWHTIAFLGEADNGKGFYYISYNGGKRALSTCRKCGAKAYDWLDQCAKCRSKNIERKVFEKTNGNKRKICHDIQVQYTSYADFAAKAKTLTTRDANGGSYASGKVRSFAAVRAGNHAATKIIRLACPVEASVSLNGMILDSEHGPFERLFGTVETVESGAERTITFVLDGSEDYQLEIRGTGEGSMDVEVEYLDADGSSMGAQCFVGVPVTPDTQITASSLEPDSTVVLYVDDGEETTAWGANPGETAYGPSEEYWSGDDAPEDDAMDEDPDLENGQPAPAYDITIAASGRGDVTASRRAAAEGAEVTLTVSPDRGYALQSLCVTGRDGQPLALTGLPDGRWHFVMPRGPVTVTAVFASAAAFTDVAPQDHFYEAVCWAVEQGVTGGTDAEHFSPALPCTRGQVVTFLWRTAGCPVVDNVMPFADVPADAYYTEAARWAVSQGITAGTGSSTFSPDEPCTRGQVVTFLWRAAGSPAANDAVRFDDVAADAYYAGAVRWAVSRGITTGTGGNAFSPDAPCTRAQIVAFLFRNAAR